MTYPIIYTRTDEAPALATASLLPIVRAFAAKAGVEVVTCDISLTSRIIAAMSKWLPKQYRRDDALAKLGVLTGEAGANIIKLPNISASLPQLKAAIKELQDHGVPVPDFPDEPLDDQEHEIRQAYQKVLGSAVNPVLRQGNSERRAPQAVKNYARNHSHSMGVWPKDSKTNVVSMSADDFAHTEQSVVIAKAQNLKVIFRDAQSNSTVLKDQLAVRDGELVDASVLRAKSLDEFLTISLKRAKDEGLLFAAHLKATMMKVSDPVIFGHVLKAYFADVFAKYGDKINASGARPRDGLGAIFQALEKIPDGEDIKAAFRAQLETEPELAMVDSDRGITCLHVPSDIIVDASMPAMIRAGGLMWNRFGQTQQTLAVIPDSSYSGVYQAVIDDCRANGALNPETMGTVPNIGLMAMAAEEYGSHDKTFEISASGEVLIVDESGRELTSHQVGAGDIWRACQTKDLAIRDWVKLAVDRADLLQMPVVFWLDKSRAHDAKLIELVTKYLGDYDTSRLTIEILNPVEATKYTLRRLRDGQSTISATGNVLRDYLTDLFPILELGTSAKMLSIVPLLSGGGLFETGAGGSAPKHVQQFLTEGHLRWDSLGEFLALGVSLSQWARLNSCRQAEILASTLDAATQRLLEEGRSPARQSGKIDNRGTHYYLASYWADELAHQREDEALASTFAPLARQLAKSEEAIMNELLAAQGKPVDIGGYYDPNEKLVAKAMRPSKTFNSLIDAF
uniref:NADP-dependent isocitrate dehydrogenase n=1 Tax=Vaginimicrobium propionicum TaxID=1871034 RepID=UPI000970883D|nr:NADP-dependent isocitrate dehydrogenase [Vaginimicrobium propionicum]